MQPFQFHGSIPKKLIVRETSDKDSATCFYSIIADYGWAERILCNQSYRHDVNDIVEILAEKLSIPFEKAV